MNWWLDFFRIVWFRWIYSTWWLQRVWFLFGIVTWLVGVAAIFVCGFFATPESPLLIRILTPISVLFSTLSLAVALFGAVLSNRTHRMLLPMGEKCQVWIDGLENTWKKVVLSQGQEAAMFKKCLIGENGDFSVGSEKMDAFLRDGGMMICKILPRRKSVLWHRINMHLPECVSKLVLKQIACRHHGFRNEGKVAIVSPLCVDTNKDAKNAEMNISIAKTDYYTSYLTNESYRDAVVDDLHSGSLQVDEEWIPYEASGDKWILTDLEDWNSMHIGVNTLGITKDNFLCLWMQVKGQHSNGLLAPTGSGSMDWADVRNIRRKCNKTMPLNLVDVVKFAAERELKEESFDKDGLARLAKCVQALRTDVIGFYRWGSRGGIPGFLCVTKIPVNYRDMRVSDKIVEVSHSIFKPIQLKGDDDNRRGDLKIICEALKDQSLSLPLIVCLHKLETAWGCRGDMDALLKRRDLYGANNGATGNCVETK